MMLFVWRLFEITPLKCPNMLVTRFGGKYHPQYLLVVFTSSPKVANTGKLNFLSLK